MISRLVSCPFHRLPSLLLSAAKRLKENLSYRKVKAPYNDAFLLFQPVGLKAVDIEFHLALLQDRNTDAMLSFAESYQILLPHLQGPAGVRRWSGGSCCRLLCCSFGCGGGIIGQTFSVFTAAGAFHFVDSRASLSLICS